MLLDGAIVIILVGLALGRGRLSRLRDLDLRAPGVFVAAAVIKIGLLALGAGGAPMSVTWSKAGYLLSYLLLLAGLVLNRHRWEFRVVGTGVLLNFLVIAANGASMPVDRALAQRAGNRALVELLGSDQYVSHTPITERTRLRPLADVLPLPMVVPRPRFFSPGSVGDVLITVGACWLILSGTGAFGMGRRPGSAQVLSGSPRGGADAPEESEGA